MSNTDLIVANTIKEQIGHRAFFMMGAKNLMGDATSLQFKVGRNPKGISHVKVTLDPSDTYTVEFTRCRINRTTYEVKVTTLSKSEDVYVEDLHGIIERGTGLYLSL